MVPCALGTIVQEAQGVAAVSATAQKNCFITPDFRNTSPSAQTPNNHNAVELAKGEYPQEVSKIRTRGREREGEREGERERERERKNERLTD